jgi:hypothetical protein
MHPLHIVYGLLALLKRLYMRLNQLEQLLAPTLVAGHKTLFSSGVGGLNQNWIKYGVLALIVGVLIFNVFEVKHKVSNPGSSLLSTLEPILKASTWVFLFTQIFHHISSLGLGNIHL